MWFNTQSKTSASSLLMGAISYVVAALSESSLCLDAANALRDLCDANRTALAPHIGAFGEIYARLSGIPVRELYWLVPTAIEPSCDQLGHGEEQSAAVHRKCDSSDATRRRDYSDRGHAIGFPFPFSVLTAVRSDHRATSCSKTDGGSAVICSSKLRYSPAVSIIDTTTSISTQKTLAMWPSYNYKHLLVSPKA